MRTAVSIRLELLLGTGAIFALLAITALVTGTLLRSRGAESLQVNLSGRQRMLDQRLMVETLLLFRAETEEQRSRIRQDLGRSVSLFDRTLRCLRDGGETMDSNGERVALPAAADDRVIAALSEGMDTWSRMRPLLMSLAEGKVQPHSPEGEQALGPALSAGSVLAAQMNTATGAFQDASEQGHYIPALVQWLALAGGLALLVLINWMHQRHVTQPLTRAVGFARAIAKGHLGERLDVGRKNEIGTLAESLNTMAEALTFETERLEAVIHERTSQLERSNGVLLMRNEQLDEFTYAASHDLQEPVRKLVSFAELLKMDIGADDLPEKASKDLGFITDAAHRMQTLVQDLLALSRSGRSEMKCERISLADCAEKALAALDTRVQETGAEITCDELPEVVGDSLLLTQLYRNLIGNALRFIAEDRPLRIHLTAEESGGEWVLGVRDNGIGIKAEYFQQIFAPFKRLHGRSKYGGSGIGLAICRKAVERHGGQIWVESEPGQGACFKFTVSKNMEIGKWKDEMARRPLCSS